MKIKNRNALGYYLLIADLVYIAIIFLLQKFNENFKLTYDPNLIIWTSIALLLVALFFIYVKPEEEENGQ